MLAPPDPRLFERRITTEPRGPAMALLESSALALFAAAAAFALLFGVARTDPVLGHVPETPAGTAPAGCPCPSGESSR